MSNDVYLGNPLLKKANTPIEWTKEMMEEWIQCMKDPVYFAKNYIKIVNVDDGLVNFNLWKFQEKLITNFHQNRFNICKMPRQVGKCFTDDTVIKLRNKTTNEIIEITVGEFYEKIQKENRSRMS